MGTDRAPALVAAFVNAADAVGRGGGSPLDAAALADPRQLDAALRGASERARTAWPELVCDDPWFCAALGRRWEPGRDPIAYAGGVHAGDLLLVLACVRGDAAALKLLDERYLRKLADELGRTASLGAFSAEAHQQLRVHLLVAPEPGREPRIAGYRGTGALMAWLRLSLTRLALDLRAVSAREVELDEELVRVPSRELDPEIAVLRQTYRDELARAMTEALAALPSEDRAMLRMHFLDGLSASEVGALFDVSGRTIQRRIADTRRAVVARTRELLSERLGGEDTPGLLETLMRLVASELDLSVRRILSADVAGEP